MKLKAILMGLVLLCLQNSLEAQTDESSFQTRVNQITNRLADTAAVSSYDGYFSQEFSGPGALPDPEKHVWPVTIARFRKYGVGDSIGNRLVHKYRGRRPFHFTYIGLARIMCQFRDAPQMMALREDYLKSVWNRTDSYNAFYGEGTENHIAMNKTSGYLFAQLSLGNPSFPEASKRLEETKTWLRWYCKNLYTKGSSEWNSSIYESYNLVGWLNVYDFALDPEVKNIARAVLDYYACEIALHSSQGLTGGPESRGNATKWGSGEDYFSWIWFGPQARQMGMNFWLSKEYSQTIHAASSSYRPPSLAVKLARKEIRLPSWFKNSKPDYGQNKPAVVKQHLYLSADFTLGSAVIPVVGFANGNRQFCNWKLVSNVKPGPGYAPEVVTGGSRFFNSKDGRGKTPFDQYVQHKNVVIQLHKIPVNVDEIIHSDTLLYTTNGTGWKDKWRADFTARFPNDNSRSNPVGFGVGDKRLNVSYISYPGFHNNKSVVRTLYKNGVFFVALERSYLAVRSIALQQPETPGFESTDRLFVADKAPTGRMCGMVMEAANKQDYPSFSAFQDAVLKSTQLDKSGLAKDVIRYRNLKGNLLEARYSENGPAGAEPLYDWGFGPVTPQNYQVSPPFSQPKWPEGAGRGTIPVLLVDGVDAGYQNSDWSVFEGPGLVVKDGRLELTNDSGGATRVYRVDVTGNDPQFSTEVITDEKKGLVNSEKPLDLLPNPASNEVTARASGLTPGEKADVYIYTLNGSLVWEEKAMPYQNDGLRIPASPLGIGVFQVVVQCRNTKYTGRLVLNR